MTKEEEKALEEEMKKCIAEHTRLTELRVTAGHADWKYLTGRMEALSRRWHQIEDILYGNNSPDTTVSDNL